MSTRRLLTGKHIHQMFRDAVPAEMSRPWRKIHPNARKTYNEVAKQINQDYVDRKKEEKEEV